MIHKRLLSYHKVKNWYASYFKPKQIRPPYNHVTQIGDPILRAPAEQIPVKEIGTKSIQSLIAQMKYIFKKHDCVGLAAPQLGVALQVIMFGVSRNNLKHYSEEELKKKALSIHPFTVVINPEVKITDYSKIVSSESCESIKGFWADVPRYKALTLKGFNEEGQEITLNAHGWLARIIQHEVDHLNARLYTDIMDRKSLTCSCWQVINEHNGKVNLPYGPH